MEATIPQATHSGQPSSPRGAPRLLVLSSALPGSRHGGGVIQDEVLRRYPKDRYVCVGVRPPYGWTAGDGMPESLRDVPCLITPLAPELRLRGSRFYRPLLRAAGFGCALPLRVRQAAAFGRRHGADLVWAELQGDALLMARPVARRLGVPLVGTVWDDPAGWLPDGNYGALSRRLMWREFRACLAEARMLSTAGEAMQRAYEREYGVHSVILRHGFESPAAAVPASHRAGGQVAGSVTVGFVGNVYGRDAWASFLEAAAGLNSSGALPRIRVRAFGRGHVPARREGVPVEHAGWQPAGRMLEEMAQTDFCYLPYWFEPGKRRHVELSFPNKFETYLAAGRPVLYHGPAYAGVAEAVRSYGVGLCVHSLDPQEVAAAIKRLIADHELRRSFGRAALAAFHAEFNAAVMVRHFAELIGVAPALLAGEAPDAQGSVHCEPHDRENVRLLQSARP